ncbi:MAG: gluconeogenesis factor YvcK family protein, partial [Dehalococcoidia bacterium]
VLALGIAYLLREVYVTYTFPGVFYYLTLQFFPRWFRGILFMGVSLSMILLAVWHLNRSLLSAVMLPGRTDRMVDLVYRARFRGRGPRVVAIGGGTGLSQLLLGLKEHTGNLTAVVTVGDDGGSSGRLREDMGMLPPGDVRNCIAALAEAEPLMRSLFQYRFQSGNGLEGHSFGNLFIAALTDIMGGNFEEAVRATSRVLAVRGLIVPSTTADVTLGARFDDGTVVWGESNITHQGRRIDQLHIRPEHVHAYPEAVDAIRQADMIVIGPGSLYTSVLPNLLVRDIRDAIRVSRAVKVYVSNVATQHGETDGYSVADHITAIEKHVGRGLIDHVLANSNIAEQLPEAWMSRAVAVDAERIPHIRLVQEDVVREDKRYHHDPAKLAAALIRLYYDREPMSRAPQAALSSS